MPDMLCNRPEYWKTLQALISGSDGFNNVLEVLQVRFNKAIRSKDETTYMVNTALFLLASIELETRLKKYMDVMKKDNLLFNQEPFETFEEAIQAKKFKNNCGQ